MKKLLLLAVVLAMWGGVAQAGVVRVDLYGEYVLDNPNAWDPTALPSSFSDYRGTIYAGAVDFGFPTDPGQWTDPWDPLSLGSTHGHFGARVTGELVVSGPGSYTFNLNSDDGSGLYIDGSLVINNGGMHAPLDAQGTVNLTQGVHSFRIDYFEDIWPRCNLNLTLPDGVGYVPEPASLLIWSTIGGLGIVGAWRRRRRAA